MKGSQDREARGKRTSRAKLETETLHSTILATDRSGIKFRETVRLWEGAEHTKPAQYKIAL